MRDTPQVYTMAPPGRSLLRDAEFGGLAARPVSGSGLRWLVKELQLGELHLGFGGEA